MFCTVSNKHTQNEITRIKQKYSNDNQKARRKIIELQPQNFIYSFQVKLNKTTYLSFKHIMCRFMIESDNVTDNLVFAVNSLITLYQIRHFYLLAKWRRGPIDIKGATEVGLLLYPYSVDLTLNRKLARNGSWSLIVTHTQLRKVTSIKIRALRVMHNVTSA